MKKQAGANLTGRREELATENMMAGVQTARTKRPYDEIHEAFIVTMYFIYRFYHLLESSVPGLVSQPVRKEHSLPPKRCHRHISPIVAVG